MINKRARSASNTISSNSKVRRKSIPSRIVYKKSKKDEVSLYQICMSEKHGDYLIELLTRMEGDYRIICKLDYVSVWGAIRSSYLAKDCMRLRSMQ